MSRADFDSGGFEWTLARGAALTGQVRDERGQSVAGARLVAGKWPDARPSIEAWSGTDGTFELPPLPAGETVVWALRAGYRACRLPVVVPPAGETSPRLELVLERGGFLAGSVVDERGEAVPFAHIYLHDMRREFHSPRYDADAAGRFRVNDLPPAPLELGFLRSGFVRHEQAFDTLDREGLLVRLQRSGGIAGRVVDGSTGEPIESFRIRLVAPVAEPGDALLAGSWAGWSSAGPGVSFAGTGGVWSTAGEELAIGAVTGVEALADGYAPTVVGRVVVRAEPDPDALRIELFAADAALGGRVVAAESGEALEGARVRTFRGHAGPSTEEGAVTTDAQGRFEFTGLGPGTTSIVVDHPRYVRAIVGPLELRSGERTGQHIALEAGASVVGRLLDARGVALAGERVRLLALRTSATTEPTHADRARDNLELETDVDGTFRFEGLSAGEYRVSWSRVLEDEMHGTLNRQVVIEAATGELPVELRPRGHTTLHGTLEGSAARAGTWYVLLRPRGLGAASAEERAQYTARLQTTLARAGRFEFEHVEAGRYSLSAMHDGRRAGQIEIEVPERGELHLLLPLEVVPR